jgi:hypothetical protein
MEFSGPYVLCAGRTTHANLVAVQTLDVIKHVQLGDVNPFMCSVLHKLMGYSL